MGVWKLLLELGAGILAIWLLMVFTLIALIAIALAGIIYALYFYNEKDKMTTRHAGDW